MHYEEVYVVIGQMGVYQFCIVLAMSLFYMFSLDAITMVFVGADMPHWCRVDELVNLSFTQQKNIAIPYSSEPGSLEYSSCQMYNLNYSAYSDEDFIDWNRTLMISDNTSVVLCTQWTYDQSTFVSTIVSEFNLVCGRDNYDELVSTIYSVGNMIGAFAGGTVSDRFGRKTALMIFNLIHTIGVVLSTTAPVLPLFMVGRLIQGIGVSSVVIIAYVTAMETIGPYYRSIVGNLLHMGMTIGFILQPLIASNVRSYVEYQLAALAPSALLIFYVIYIPESMRWLLVTGKTERAQKVLQHICDVNGTKLPSNFHLKDIENLHKGGMKPKANVISLFKAPRLRCRTLIILLTWFSCSLMYYGLSLNTGALPGDIFINTLISGAVEVPAIIAGYLLMNWSVTGRRFTMCGSLLVAGLSSLLCIPTVLLAYDSATTSLSMVGKCAIALTFGVVYVSASEVFPTEVRNVGMALGSISGGTGSMIAPYFGTSLVKVWKPLPSLIIGAIASTAGLCSLFLPEMLGQPLPDTIQQAEHINIIKKRSKEKFGPSSNMQDPSLVGTTVYVVSSPDINA